MEHLKIYEVSSAYINYLAPEEPHLFRNKEAGQNNERKYIGVLLTVNGLNYFAPMSSFKDKHHRMKDSVDFVKIKNYAVINLNNMFPVPMSECRYINISDVRDVKYRSLLLAEYRYIKSIEDRLRKNASALYKIIIKEGNSSALSKRCNDFVRLERLCREYSDKST